MTSYQRTQMYLDPEDHRRLKRLAAERGQSMTDLVREAVARYVADELADEVPSVDEMMAELRGDPLYDGLPSGSEGFVARTAARAAADAPPPATVRKDDRDLGAALFEEHTDHVRRWTQRHRSNRSASERQEQ